jgi:adenosylcobinamide-GDP ribazoletransferase
VSALRSTLREVALALVFFTRFPLPRIDFNGLTLAGSLWAAPIAGLVVGIICGTTFALAAWLGLATGPSAALALAAGLLVTGALHEDGLSDTADGFGGGTSRERKLEIMRDSRIGAYGACALVMSLLLRWTALAAIVDPWNAMLALVAAHCASRGPLAAFMSLLPSARVNGLAAEAGRVSINAAIAGLILGGLALLVMGPLAALIAVACIALVFIAFRSLCLRAIGGHTGDTVGALQQLCEITVLLVASATLT